MLKKYFSKKSALKKSAAAIGLALLLIVQTLPVFASEPRDYDSNAIIYGGAYSISELNDRLQNGSGPNPAGGVYGNWQTPNGVRTFYNAVGIREEQWGVQVDGKQHFVNGSVNKSGQVIVGGTVVASGVFSAGRVNMGASTLVNYGPIPIYWREPKYSFASNTLDAFVYLNTDGTFGYAIIKSCGNPVLKSNLTANVLPIEQKFNLAARKYNDKNHNGKKDIGEPMIEGWKFTVKGNGITKTGTTGPNGTTVFKDLKKGTYKVIEEHRADWVNTTGGETQSVNLKSDKTIFFGNSRLYNIFVVKFDDKNANGKRDTGENYLKGFRFTVSGNGVTKSLVTGSDGVAKFTGLLKASYKVTETQQSGWTSTTGLTKTIDLGPTSRTVNFGNRLVPKTTTVAKNRIKIVKFHDRNKDGNVDSGEENLPNWEFTLTGNGVNIKKRSDANGNVLFDNLENGSYTVKETLISGWENTTGDNIKVDLTNGDDITLIVGNNEIEVLGKTTERGEVLGTTATKGGLPQAGAAEATVAFSLTSLGASGLYWLRSKKAVLLALKKSGL